jgi:alkylhydroperoxidase family enzyme
MPVHITLSQVGVTPFEKIIGHNPSVLTNWLALERSVFSDTNLDANLLEQVRRTLAFGNECEYCMVKAGKPDVHKANKRILAAVAFAEMFIIDHTAIVAGHFDELKTHFTEKEISALTTFIAFISACQKLGRVMNLTEEYQNNKITNMALLFNNQIH